MFTDEQAKNIQGLGIAGFRKNRTAPADPESPAAGGAA